MVGALAFLLCLVAVAAAPLPVRAQVPAAEDTAPQAQPPEVISRLSGATRGETAVALSQVAFPDGASVVVLAREDTFPDALAGGPLAGALGGPLLLTRSDGLSEVAAAEIRRLGVQQVVLLGGEGALSPAVEQALLGLGVPQVRRIAGQDRFDTAARIAAELPPTGEVYLTRGADADGQAGWADAVAVGALATRQGRPILLATEGDALPPATAAALDALSPQRVTLVGGRAVLAEAIVAELAARNIATRRIGGNSRVETASRVAVTAVGEGAAPQRVWIATADALTPARPACLTCPSRSPASLTGRCNASKISSTAR